MRWSALVVCVAACGFEPGTFSRDPHAGDGGPDAPVGDVDAFVDGDTDGDGVLNSVDNCPALTNVDQRNHDGDPRGDACDRCPHLDTGAVDPDGDGDMIGDSCDPRPTTAGDTLLIWDGYYDSSQHATWSGTGQWSVANGFLSQSDTTQNQAYTYAPMSVDRHAITTGVRVDVVGTVSGTTGPAVYIAGGSNGTVQYYVCGVYPSTSNRVYALTRWPVGNGSDGDFDEMTWSGSLAAGSELRLYDAVAGGEHRCTATQGSVSVPIVQDHGGTAGAIVLLTQRMAASFDYVHVVGVGN